MEESKWLPEFEGRTPKLARLLIKNASRLMNAEHLHDTINQKSDLWEPYKEPMDKGYVGHTISLPFLCVINFRHSDMETLELMYLFRCSSINDPEDVSYQWITQLDDDADFINNAYRPVTGCWNDEGVTAFVGPFSPEELEEFSNLQNSMR